jgi:hypothetical protein
LFAEAKKLAKDGDWPGACVALEKSYAIRAALPTKYRLAECYEHVGRVASARKTYLEVAAMAGESGETDKQHEAQAYATKLAARVPKLTISVQSPQPGLVVTRNDVVIPPKELGVATEVDPGSYSIRARAPGHQGFAKSVTLAEGAAEVIAIPMLAADEAPPPTPSDESSPTPVLRTVGLITAGVGVGTLAVGGYFFFSARARYAESDAHCPRDLCDAEGIADADAGRSRMRTATWLLTGGALLVGTGVTLALLWPSAPKAHDTGATVAITVGPFGAWATGHF